MNQHQNRYDRTLSFIKKHVPECKNIFDLGTPNAFSDILKENGYTVYNTSGEDLDNNPECVTKFKDIDLVTSLEIFEHLLNPYSVLKNLPAKKIVTSIPLSLWFAKAYRSKTDEWDRHFHEFEDWQFDWLLEKAGWKIIAREKWAAPTKNIGWRPLLRKFTPRYQMIYAEKL